ncbi:MAG: TIGR04552 family protein [Myxococcota bacterium]|nr:TIGR04552 family protein [Myxococcota bacterium]
MSRDIFHVDASFEKAFSTESLTLQDLEAVRLTLQGSSVIDWNKLNFQSLEEVDQFLSMHLIDVSDPMDLERLHFVFNQAVTYLEEDLDVRFPEDLRNPEDVREVFMAASTYTGRFRRRQTLACMLLKLMHVINHMEAADLKFQIPVPEAKLLDRAEKRIIEHAERLRESGYPLLAFYGSRKTRTSTITKLLAKRETIAATIFDKLRFRLVVENSSEILPLIAHLSRTLFPFNYVIPGQSHNNILHFKKALKENPHFSELSPNLQRLRPRASEWLPEKNPFSGSNYRMINFIVDFPVRVDELVDNFQTDQSYILGRDVFVLVEFQVIDAKTARENEQGENAHHLYKKRQRKIVESRLLRGSRSRLKDFGEDPRDR